MKEVIMKKVCKKCKTEQLYKMYTKILSASVEVCHKCEEPLPVEEKKKVTGIKDSVNIRRY